MAIRRDRSSWSIEPRHVRARHTYERGSACLNGFAVDLSVRFSDDGGSAFLEDHNSTGTADVMRFGTLDELFAFLTSEITRNHATHFGQV